MHSHSRVDAHEDQVGYILLLVHVQGSIKFFLDLRLILSATINDQINDMDLQCQ